MPYITKAERDRARNDTLEAEWQARRAAEAARWAAGNAAAEALRAAGYQATGFYESVIISSDDALRLLALSARQEHDQ